MPRPRRVNRGGLLFGAACFSVALIGRWAPQSFVGGHSQGSHARDLQRLSRSAAPGGMNMAALEELMKDPEKLKQLQAEMDAVMKDPEKRKAIEKMQDDMKSAVDKLKEDPELQDFFEDVKKNGLEGMKKWENDERVLRKFSQATGGPANLANMYGMGGAGMGAAPPMAAPVFKPGDQVIIKGLEKAPQLNGKKAMVVPASPEEKKTLEGTDRLIVRLLDTGEQFAVLPSKLRSTKEEADDLMSQSLEDVSLYNPALQTEAAKLRESGKLNDLQNDPELKPVFEDIRKNGMGALEKYWNDERLMAKISKAMGNP